MVFILAAHLYKENAVFSCSSSSTQPLLLRNGTEFHIMKRRHAHFSVNYLNPFWCWKLKSKSHFITWCGHCVLEEQKCYWARMPLDHVSERILCQYFSYFQSYIPLKVVYMWVLQMTFGTNKHDYVYPNRSHILMRVWQLYRKSNKYTMSGGVICCGGLNKMASTGSCIWMLSYQEVELFNIDFSHLLLDGGTTLSWENKWHIYLYMLKWYNWHKKTWIGDIRNGRSVGGPWASLSMQWW